MGSCADVPATISPLFSDRIGKAPIRGKYGGAIVANDFAVVGRGQEDAGARKDGVWMQMLFYGKVALGPRWRSDGVLAIFSVGWGRCSIPSVATCRSMHLQTHACAVKSPKVQDPVRMLSRDRRIGSVAAATMEGVRGGNRGPTRLPAFACILSHSLLVVSRRKFKTV